MFLIFIYSIFKKVYLENEEKIKLILVGCTSLILIQAMIHIGVNIRLFPTTGMTLPFISYGGSSIISISILSGIILNLTKEKLIKMKKKILISTGGSGGHVIPAIILYEHLSKKYDVMISTDIRGLKFLDKNDHQIEIVNTPKLNNFLFLPLNLLLIMFMTLKSFFLLKKKKNRKNIFYRWIYVNTFNFSCKVVKT